jgi:hypothetical protein
MNTPFFFGPLHITASDGFSSKNPTDITARLSSMYYWKENIKYHINNPFNPIIHWVLLGAYHLLQETSQIRFGEPGRLKT